MAMPAGPVEVVPVKARVPDEGAAPAQVARVVEVAVPKRMTVPEPEMEKEMASLVDAASHRTESAAP
jgi:hypothetical protein